MNTSDQSNPICLAECPSGPKEESKLLCGEAMKKYGICVRHGQMKTNGELRFRLNSTKDGSAYIRTQTTGESQGWQKPHFHKHLKETYIVEQGWIGYVELVNEEPVYKKYEPGDVFTTSPNVIHNIYMPADSVIHTVKHGAGPTAGESGKPDWWGDNPECKNLAQIIGSSFPCDILRTATRSDLSLIKDPEKIYNAAYRHFDTLIWQVPAWSSALFAAIVASVNLFLTHSSTSTKCATQLSYSTNGIAAIFQLPSNILASIPIGLFGIFTLILGYALYRFRWHQVGTRTWYRTAKSPKVSPQTLLQSIVIIESGLLLFVTGALAGLAGFQRSAFGIALTLINGSALYYWEHMLIKREKDLLDKGNANNYQENIAIRGAS